MRHTMAVLAATAAAGIALTGCSTSSHSTPAHSTTAATVQAAPASEPPVPTDSKLATGRTAACWKAIRDQYTPGTVQLTGEPTTPPACAGLTSDEISAVASDVLEHQLG